MGVGDGVDVDGSNIGGNGGNVNGGGLWWCQCRCWWCGHYQMLGEYVFLKQKTKFINFFFVLKINVKGFENELETSGVLLDRVASE